MLCALGSQPLGLLTSFFWLVLFQLKPLGCDGNSQPSVPAWLDSLGLQDYVQSFLSSGYSSIDTVKNLWELEIVNVSTALLPPRQPGAATSLRGWDLPGVVLNGGSAAQSWKLRCVPSAGKPTVPRSAPAGVESESARPSEEDHRLPGRPALRGTTCKATTVLAAESESLFVLLVLAVAGMLLLPWLCFAFLPFLQRTNLGFVRDNCPISDEQFSLAGDPGSCRGRFLRAQVLDGGPALLCCCHAQAVLPGDAEEPLGAASRLRRCRGCERTAVCSGSRAAAGAALHPEGRQWPVQ